MVETAEFDDNESVCGTPHSQLEKKKQERNILYFDRPTKEKITDTRMLFTRKMLTKSA